MNIENNLDYFIKEIILKNNFDDIKWYRRTYQYLEKKPNSRDIINFCQLFLDFSKSNYDSDYTENVIKIICLIQDIIFEVQPHLTESKKILIDV
jgi:hypothetical protein